MRFGDKYLVYLWPNKKAIMKTESMGREFSLNSVDKIKEIQFVSENNDVDLDSSSIIDDSEVPLLY